MCPHCKEKQVTASGVFTPTNTFWVLWSASAGYHRGQGARSPAKKCRLTKATLTLTSGHLASYPHLLVTLLLRYRLRNQSRLTCKHVAVQVQRWEVVAWRKQKGDKKEKDQVSPLHAATLPGDSVGLRTRASRGCVILCCNTPQATQAVQEQGT